MKLSDKIMNCLMIFIIVFIICPIVFVSSVILIDSYKNSDDIPSFFGWKPFIVLSDSMEPEIYSGDLIIVEEIDYSTVKVDDVIAFRTQNIVVTHRVVDMYQENDDTYFITKGDNNSANDDFKISYDNLEGIYKFKIRGLGKVAMFLQSTTGMLICLFVPIFLIFIKEFYDDFRFNKSQKN